MEESLHQIAKLFIAKEDGRSTIRLFTADPTPLEEKNLGRLFAVMEIDSQEAMNDDILEIITDELKNLYYQSESFEMEAAFEHALQKTNQKIQEIVGEVGDEWLNLLNIVVGVQRGENLIFANVGRVIALMVHKNEIIDILDTTKAKAQDINPIKVFGNIVSGEITETGIILFSIESILDYLSKEKIKRILVDNNTQNAIEEFHTLLEEDTTNTNFAALIMRRQPIHAEDNTGNTEEKADSIPIINPPSTTTLEKNDSMSRLVDQENKTDDLLTSSIWPGIKKTIKKASHNLKTKTANTTPSEKESTVDNILDSSTPIKKKTPPQNNGISNLLMSGARWIGTFVLHTLRILIKLIQKGFSNLLKALNKKRAEKSSMSTRTTRAQRRSFSTGATNSIAKIIQWLQKLSTIQKAFFVIAIVVLLLFAQSVINRGEKRITNEQEDQFAIEISDIDVKINEGRAAALYDNEAARTLFIEARTMLENIPKDSDAYKERGEELSIAITEQLKEVNNLVELSNLTPVINYADINSNISINNIILLGASMYGFDANNGSVYRGNLENQGTTVTISDAGSENQFVRVIKASPGTGIAIHKDQSFSIFNPITETLSKINLGYENADYDFQDIVVFGTRLYVLDKKNNQIFRHRKTDDTFETGEEWITDGSKLENSISMAVDGAIYILEKNGTLNKFESGSKSDFALSSIDPALTTADEIYTDENTENIYILDKTNNRVIIFGKDGSLIKQITSSEWTNVKDMVVDEANNRLFILDGTALYEIDLSVSVNSEETATNAKPKTANA